jgi:hypothetical protein
MQTIRQAQLDAMAQAQGRSVVQPCKTAWVEVQVLDMENNPVSGVRYEIRLPDGSTVTGSTDKAGSARYEKIVSGQCEICLPDFDREAWAPL